MMIMHTKRILPNLKSTELNSSRDTAAPDELLKEFGNAEISSDARGENIEH